MPVADIDDPALYDATFDPYNRTSSKNFQNVPLDIRRHRPSFVIMSTAAYAKITGRNQGEHANIIETTSNNSRFEASTTKTQVKRYKRMQQKVEEIGSRPEQTADSRGERRIGGDRR